MNVGSYAITVRFKSNYAGTAKASFTIVPKTAAITKVTPRTKGFSVKWKKPSGQVTGYEIQYSTSSKFAKKATKTVNVGKSSATSKSVSKLKAGKKYYIKVRAYKTAKVDGKSIKLYSAWSMVKRVTAKK